MKPLDPGTLFDTLAARGSRTLVRLSRPLDLAPDAGTCWDVRALARLVRSTAARLAAAGVRPGDHVAVVKRNHWDYVLLACAAARIGAVPALLSDRVPTAALDVLLARLRPAVLLTEGPLLRAAAEQGTDLTRHAARTLTLDPGPGALAALPDDGPCPVPRRHDDDPLVVIHTSGTTGVPKLVVHSTTTLIRRLAGFEARRWPVLTARGDDTVASAISFAHGRALAWTVSALWHRPRQLVIIDDCDPAAALPVLRAHPPTVLEALPSGYVRWQSSAAEPDHPFRDVRLFISTFDAVHPPTVRTLLAATRHRRPVWMQGWGQSETGPLSFRFFTRRSLAVREGRHPTTRNLGRPVPGRVALRVVDPQTFAPLPRGRTGLVLARTRARCVAYLGEEERLREKVHGDWFNTGDLGSLTPSGALLLFDREVDMIPGTSCVELEDVLHDRLAEVEEAVLLGAPGRDPLPLLVTTGGTLDRHRWAHAVHDLPPLDQPVLVDRDAVPRTATGKVRRHELRHRYLQGAAGFGTGRWT